MSRPHLVLVIDNSGSMSTPQPDWCNTFNAIVDAVRYFSNTPLVSVLLFGGSHRFQSYKVPADHLQRFEWGVTYHADSGGTMLYSGLEGAINKCLSDKDVNSVPTQFLVIHDGGNGDGPRKPLTYDNARAKKWGIAFIGPVSYDTSMIDIQRTTNKGVPIPGDLCLVDVAPNALNTLSLKGAEALENWMKVVARGKPAPQDFWGTNHLIIRQ